MDSLLSKHYGDILSVATREVEVEIFAGRVQFAKSSAQRGWGVRAIEDGREGLAHTQKPDEIHSSFEKATKVARLTKGLPTALVAATTYPKVAGLFDDAVASVTPDEAIGEARILADHVSARGLNLAHGAVSFEQTDSRLQNSLGLDVAESATACSVYASVVAEGGSTGFAYHVGRSRDYDLAALAEDACTLAEAGVNAKPVKSGDYAVLFEPHAFSDLLTHVFGPAVNADRVQRGKSMLADKLGETIAASTLSITDDGRYPGGVKSGICDGEGTPMQSTPLIEEGVLAGFLYDVKRAKKEGKGSTGNGLRGYDSLPRVGASNVLVTAGDARRDELLAAADLDVYAVVGAHTANPTTGEFAVEVENAYTIVKGARGSGVKKAIITGNIYDLLKQISLVGKKPKQTGNAITPAILAENVKIVV